MNPTVIVPGLFGLDLGGVNAYVLIENSSLTLIDTGYPGSLARLTQQLGVLGYQLADLTQIVVTHCHPDHAGSLAELQAQTNAQTWMHPLDAALVRSGVAKRANTRPTPGLLNSLIYRLTVERAPATLAAARVDHEVADQAVLPFAGIEVLHVPGHSAGQIALRWPRHGGVLIAADTAINMAGLALFPAYEDLAEGKRSLARLASLDFTVACFGHGQPIKQAASARFRARFGRLV